MVKAYEDMLRKDAYDQRLPALTTATDQTQPQTEQGNRENRYRSVFSSAAPNVQGATKSTLDISQATGGDVLSIFNNQEQAMDYNSKFLPPTTNKKYSIVYNGRNIQENVKTSTAKRDVQSKSSKIGDHLFFFPIKRDTLLQLLPQTWRQSYEAIKKLNRSSEKKQSSINNQQFKGTQTALPLRKVV